ncbi:MAG: DUF1127 domain-containing protein [Rhodobacteraceae bacterium]|nr:DUF1127 domain-containing protein [Paracoccaceae bacterium]
MAYSHTATHIEFHLLRRIQQIVTDYRTALKLRREYIRTYKELDALSDYDLSDIGVSRHNIADIAREHVYGV